MAPSPAARVLPLDGTAHGRGPRTRHPQALPPETVDTSTYVSVNSLLTKGACVTLV